MPIHPFGSETITLTKSPREGNRPRFSNGKQSVEIIAWDVKNSLYKRQYSPHSKVFNDETRLVLRTHDPVALELETDDSATWEGIPYSVQEVHLVDVPLGINKKNYEISLR